MLSPEVFRRRLIERVAFDSPFARRWAIHGPDAKLAEQLGLHPSLLDDAASLLRGGALPKADARPDLVNVELSVPQPLAVPFESAVAAMDSMSHGQLVRSLLHVMMQTTREPSLRAPRRWHKGKGAIVHGFGFRGQMLRPNTDKRKHLELTLSRGLSDALGKRAAAYGATKTRYILLWMADLADGFLADYVFPPISTDQMFPEDTFYVLPVIETVVEETDGASSEAGRNPGPSA